MSLRPLSRRAALAGAMTMLSGCAALSALGGGGKALDTFDLTPPPEESGRQGSSRTLVVARPEAPAAIITDRIVVKPDRGSITHLPGARWSAEAPALVQSLLIRAVSGTGRMGYVGQVENGPVADRVLLARIDAFQAEADPAGTLIARVDLTLTLLNDADQSLVASRSFAGSAAAANDSAAAVVAAFQVVMDHLLPPAAAWVASA